MVTYEILNKVVHITGCSEEETDVVIPDFIEDFPVGMIKANAFNEMPNLKRVVMPKNMKMIGAFAFAGCKRLSEVILNPGLEIIEDWAFISCSIKEIELPDSIKSIGDNCFTGNLCKATAEKFASELKKQKKRKGPRKDNMAIFPIELAKDPSRMPNDIIGDWSKEFATEVIDFENGDLKCEELSLPLIFDGSEFLISLFHRKSLDSFEVIMDPDCKPMLGKYRDDDPDFLVLKLQVFGDGDYLGEVQCKVPYLEDAKFEVTNFIKKDDKGFRFFLKVKADLACYGNGNTSREFAFNLFDHVDGRYKKLLDCKLITEEDYNNVHEQNLTTALEILKDYLTSIEGTPMIRYLIGCYQAIENDPEVKDKKGLSIHKREMLERMYHALGDYQSFENVCFDVKEDLDFLYQFVGLDEEAFKVKYNIDVVTTGGKLISEEEMKQLRNRLIDSDLNFDLYSDSLVKMYQAMQTNEKVFSMLPFAEED